MCFGGSGLRLALVFQVRGTGGIHDNVFGRGIRYGRALISKLPTLWSRSKHKVPRSFFKEVDPNGIAQASDWSTMVKSVKVSLCIGNDGHHDLDLDEILQRGCRLSMKDEEDIYDFALDRKLFPSITFGSSQAVKLYDNLVAETCYVSCTSDKLIDKDAVLETWPCRDTILPRMSSTLLETSTSALPVELPSYGQGDNHNSHYPDRLEEVDGKIVSETALSLEIVLDKPISCIAGLRRKEQQQLEECGFLTLRKLLHHFPRTYADLKSPIVGFDDGQYVIFVGRIFSSKAERRASCSFLEVIVECDAHDHDPASEREMDYAGVRKIYMHLKTWYSGIRFTYMRFLTRIQQKHKVGDMVCVTGKVKRMPTEDHFEMTGYRLVTIENTPEAFVDAEGKPYPIYSAKGALRPLVIKDMIARVLPSLSGDIDPIPKRVREKFGLLHLPDAYAEIHQPKDMDVADLARKRFIFDDFFYFQLGRLYQMLEGLSSRVEKEGLLEKFKNPLLHGVVCEEWSTLTQRFLKALPYSLTSSQLSAISDIIWDLRRPVPMKRLLQGDVGCGKTVVAFLACMEVVGSGYQVAFMAPTELLAKQHHDHLKNLLDNMDTSDTKPSVALLTGSTSAKEARSIRERLQAGEISFVIGTHSLINPKVEFAALRLAVTDEQQCFGVIQRGLFNSKLSYSSEGEMAPHVLAMSATPIPRTLALTLYGDISLTQITDLPPGRTPIVTHAIEGNEVGLEKVYQMMSVELDAGGKVYLVYPIIGQSVQLPHLRAATAELKYISERFPSYTCGLLHGRLKSAEKQEALEMFRNGKTHILLSTQVIEVGVDVPDASMMVVMNAERFGTAQLHQLRGRVGRGSKKSTCIFVGSTSSSLGRLKVLETSSDGFHLAKVDLLLRGPGDLLGRKQSGHIPEFPIARLEVDGNLLQESHSAALEILSMSPDLEQFPALKAELSMRQQLSILGD
ncbi:ATP-dependent DNA helicase homolog RECG, chloroplastic-like protein [Drosera capensis]